MPKLIPKQDLRLYQELNGTYPRPGGTIFLCKKNMCCVSNAPLQLPGQGLLVGSTTSVFNDGEDCVFVARDFGAKSIRLVDGFDFEGPGVKQIKKNKLKCAKKLIKMLEA